MTRLIPESWLPAADVERVIIHWTGGAYAVTATDRRHYHVILEDRAALKKGTGVVAYRGTYTPVHNVRIVEPHYAAHTRRLNTKSFGLCAACMGAPRGATGNDRCQPGGPYGKWPLTPALWTALAQAAAEVCRVYGLTVDERTVLQHGEVERVYGERQRGKWDVTELPFNPPPGKRREAVCGEFREQVAAFLAYLATERPEVRVAVGPGEPLPLVRGYLEAGTSYVPVRVVAGALGASVLHTTGEAVALLRRDGEHRSLPLVIDPLGTGYVAARALGTALGVAVTWDGASQLVRFSA